MALVGAAGLGEGLAGEIRGPSARAAFAPDDGIAAVFAAVFDACASIALRSLNGDPKPSLGDAALRGGAFAPPCLRFFAIGEQPRDGYPQVFSTPPEKKSASELVRIRRAWTKLSLNLLTAPNRVM